MAAKNPFRAYQGDEPYVFVAYSHADLPVAHEALAELNEFGFRVWYDEGITPSRDWPDVIAKKIRGCSAFVVLLSKNAVASEDVKNEIHFALEEKKQFLANYLAEIVLPDGLRLRLSMKQAILRYTLEPNTFETKIRETLPNEALRPTAPAGPAQDKVGITLFAPTHVERGKPWLVQVWARADESGAGLLELAKEFDPAAEFRATVDPAFSIIRGTRLSFHLQLDDAALQCARERTWNGWADMAPLRTRVPEDTQFDELGGSVTVSLDGLPVSRLNMVIRLSDQERPVVNVEEPEQPNQVYLCYASEDRDRVTHYAQILRRTGADAFMDVMSLQAGANWADQILQAIESSDSFILFWSPAAAASAFVERELKHALSLGRDQFIRPVLLEAAPIPNELANLHFQLLAPTP